MTGLILDSKNETPAISPAGLPIVRQLCLTWDVLSVMYITYSAGKATSIMCMFWEGEKRREF
jgi:hypothetical protein